MVSMPQTVFDRPLPDFLRGVGWAIAGVSLSIMTLLQIAQQLLANLTLRPVVATIQVVAAVVWLGLCCSLAYLSLR